MDERLPGIPEEVEGRMRVAVVGRTGLGGMVMRGDPVAKALGASVLDVKPFTPKGHYDVILLVKYHGGFASRVRESCDRLIYDPLDCWGEAERWVDPVQFWKHKFQELRFNDILATSPACQSLMREALSETNIHLAPHHADPAVNPDWHDPTGPIVYAGGSNYVMSGIVQIRRACQRIGREFRIDLNRSALKSLRGCSLMLNPRLPPFDSPLNRYCKPQVKAENCAAAGMRMLASDDPCVTSWRDVPVATTDEWLDDEKLERRIKAAFDSPPLSNPVTLQSHVEFLRSIL
jgi:hypothetical protein